MPSSYPKPFAGSLAGLADHLKESNDVPAVISFSKDRVQTHSAREIGETAVLLARGIQEKGVNTGDRVLLLAPASPRFMIAALAAMRAGAVMTPVDMQLGDDSLVHVLKASRAKILFTTAKLAKRLEKLEAVPSIPAYLLDMDDDTEIQGAQSWKRLVADKPARPVQAEADDIAVLFYTSGTTGPPKGVPLSHANILSQVRMIEQSRLLSQDDRLLLPLPLHHVYPVVIGMLGPLALNIPIILPYSLTGGELTRAMRDGEASILLGVPRLYRALFNGIQGRFAAAGRLPALVFDGLLALSRLLGRLGLRPGRRLFRTIHRRAGPKVRLLASGGSPLDPALAADLEALGWPVAVGYGLTETSPLLTLKFPGEGRHASVGRAVQGVQLRVDPSVLPEGRPEPGTRPGTDLDERGELLARGANVFARYDDLPEKTAQSFDGEWFRTGDIASIDADGFVFLHGRLSSMIVLESGENIDPEKVEESYEECPEIAEIGILEEHGRLAALVVPEKQLYKMHSEEEIPSIIRKALDQRGSTLPSYQHVHRVEIARQPLDRTRLGKLKRKQLADGYAAAKLGKDLRKPVETGPVASKDMTSEDRAMLEDPRVQKLWDMLAKRYADRLLSPESNLEFDLDVDSLGWVELSMAIESEIQVSVDETWFERIHTVHELMEAVSLSGDEETQAAGARLPLEQPELVIPAKQQRLAEPRGPIRLGIAAALYLLIRVFMRCCFRIRAKGLENVPDQGAFVLMPNHLSYLDPFVVSVVLGYSKVRRCFWVGLTRGMFRNVLFRAFSRIAQVVPIEGEKGPVSSLAFGALILKRGHPLVWFPEGHRSRDGKMQPFRQGIGLLLSAYEVPVIPVFIEGTDRALPPGRMVPRPARINIHFDKPIAPDELRRAATREGEDQPLHASITKTLEQTLLELGDKKREAARS